MTSGDESDHLKSTDDLEYRELCADIGRALICWQDVEKAHFRMFRRMLDLPAGPVVSVVYFSSESFEARHRMLSRMAAYFMKSQEHKKRRAKWQVLEKEIKDANDNRNKLAHYSLEYAMLGHTESEDGSITFHMGPGRLEPAPDNFVSRILGRTPDKDGHSLSSKEIRGYASVFLELGGRMDRLFWDVPGKSRLHST